MNNDNDIKHLKGSIAILQRHANRIMSYKFSMLVDPLIEGLKGVMLILEDERLERYIKNG